MSVAPPSSKPTPAPAELEAAEVNPYLHDPYVGQWVHANGTFQQRLAAYNEEIAKTRKLVRKTLELNLLIEGIHFKIS